MRYRNYEEAVESAEAYLRRKNQTVLVLRNKSDDSFKTVAAGAYHHWTIPMRDQYQIMKTVSSKYSESEDLHMSTGETLEMLIENYWPEDDKFNQAELDDTRRPRLTLRHLNKLRKIQELKKLEMMAHKDFVKTMYGTPPEGEEPEF